MSEQSKQQQSNLASDSVGGDLPTAPPKRPAVSDEMIVTAATKLAATSGWDHEQALDIASVYRRYMDGYELAKALESDCCWDISVLDVEALDCMGSEVDSLHNEACKQWAEAYNIQPPLPIGTMTTRGEITGIYEHGAACYLVRENGSDERRRLIIRFEDARAANASEQA